jgi:thymidine phosphorylase
MAVPAPRAGYVGAVDARRIGELVIAMGGGRRRKEDVVDPAVGVRLLRKRGDRVAAGEALALIQARRDAPEWTEAAARAYTIGDEPPDKPPLVLEEIAP